ncbi:hypothetical protein COA01_23155 [Bacillus cereus]|uniref:hypothetical protein n=1 Tax=Bacillus cereus TaxID=1396 RepID=UPI000BFE4672|nr:hypothetical protein [Bacillus cereus]PGP18643.1 hypothetical protein COA01_23155 [Bacillus cereus]
MEENTIKYLVVEVLVEVYKQLFGKTLDDFDLEDKLEVIVDGDWLKLSNWFLYTSEMLDVTIKYMPLEEKSYFNTFQDALTYFEERVKDKEAVK